MTVKIPWRPMKPRCPSCRTPITEVRADLDHGQLLCQACDAALDPSSVIPSWNVDGFAAVIPDERRDQFLSEIGFERRPTVRSSGLAVALLLFLLPVVTAVQCSTVETWFARVFVLFNAAAFALLVVRLYRDEKGPRWRRMREG